MSVILLFATRNFTIRETIMIINTVVQHTKTIRPRYILPCETLFMIPKRKRLITTARQRFAVGWIKTPQHARRKQGGGSVCNTWWCSKPSFVLTYRCQCVLIKRIVCLSPFRCDHSKIWMRNAQQTSYFEWIAWYRFNNDCVTPIVNV